MRGELGVDLDVSVAYKIGRALAQHFSADVVIVGRDARESSPELAQSVISGITDFGADVLDLGLSGTEEMYWAVTSFGACAGVEITASHNPISYNGMKIVKRGAFPLETVADFDEIKRLSKLNNFETSSKKGTVLNVSFKARDNYVKKVLSFIDVGKLSNLKIVVNCGNGAAGPTFDAIANELSRVNSAIEFVRMHHEPDHSFPNGIPNPLLVQNQLPTQEMILKHKADFGIAFDGDFDRCFFFDENGLFVSGEYLVGFLASYFLENSPNENIVHDPRVVWNIQDTIKKKGGSSIVSKTGHAFIKQKMRDTEAIYGGELSAHHYFKDFSYCDSGMIPWLLVAKVISDSGESLGNIIKRQKAKFPSSGEINLKVNNSDKVFQILMEKYSEKYIKCCKLDGLSLEFEDWRFNLRKSNTEPLVRLNVEAKNNKLLVDTKLKEIISIIKAI